MAVSHRRPGNGLENPDELADQLWQMHEQRATTSALPSIGRPLPMALVNIAASVARTKGFAAQEAPCSSDLCERRLDIDGVGLERMITLRYISTFQIYIQNAYNLVVVRADVRYGGKSDPSGST
jgi:hypothetical protein